MKTDRGLLLVISGPAGSGKGTVIKSLMEKSDSFSYSVSATTRAPRPGEINGVNYHYITKEDFQERIANGGMLEYTEYCGNLYGTPKKEAEEVLLGGKNLILEIEVEGAMNVKKLYNEAVLIMLLPPSFAKQEERLRGRGTETEEKILARLAQTKKELAVAENYDYVAYNRDGGADDTADDILAIVRAEKLRLSRNPDVATRYFE
ncbi:MAG: guanylate kinase [Clostridia bacterium]|nr:guanylate kinase [Clostridia bacterium]